MTGVRKSGEGKGASPPLTGDKLEQEMGWVNRPLTLTEVAVGLGLLIAGVAAVIGYVVHRS